MGGGKLVGLPVFRDNQIVKKLPVVLIGEFKEYVQQRRRRPDAVI